MSTLSLAATVTQARVGIISAAAVLEEGWKAAAEPVARWKEGLVFGSLTTAYIVEHGAST